MPIYTLEVNGQIVEMEAENEQLAIIGAEKFASEGPGTALPDGTFEVYVDAPPPDPSTLREDQGLGVAVGAFKPLDNAALALDAGLRGIGVPTDRIADFLGTPTTRGAVEGREDYIDQRAREGVRPGTAGQIAGEIAGTLPLALVTKNPFALGALGGAATTEDRSLGGVAQNAALGAAAGKVGQVAFDKLAGVVAPKLSPGVRKLMDEGVALTPAQRGGGVARQLEDVAASLPITGPIVQAGRDRSLESFNAAALNRALSPINERLPKGMQAGHEAVSYVGDRLSQGYDDVLPGLGLELSPEVRALLAGLKESADVELPPAQADQFTKIIAERLLRGVDEAGRMTGEGWKLADTDLGRLAGQYGGSPDPAQRIMAELLRDAQGGMRGALDVSNPQAAETLGRLNAGWRNLVVTENAAGRAGSESGVFTPSGLKAATRATDRSVRKRASARGEANMQDLAEAGIEVMNPTIGNSGTATRNPGTLNTLLGALLAAPAAAVYSKPGIAAGNAIAKRPEYLQELSDQLRMFVSPRAGGLFGGALASQQSTQ